MHAARHGWELGKDAPLFMNWAIHTGKYRPGIDKPDPKTWKANFRCAMNSLPDIEEVKDESIKRGSNAFRMYRMLTPTEKAVKKGRKKMDTEQRSKRVFQKRKASTPRKYNMLKQLEKMKKETEITPDSTVLLTENENFPMPTQPIRQVTVGELTEVCAVVEVSAADEDPSISSTKVSYPLQDSHVSSYSDSDTDSTYSEDDSVQDLSLNVSQRSSCSSVLKIPPSSQSSTFSTSGKTNFRVTSYREDSPLIAYNTDPWLPFLLNPQSDADMRPLSPTPTPDLTSSPTRASVIADAIDLSVTKRKAQC